MKRYPYIAIEGNIGVGKTSLVKRYAEHVNAKAFYEQFDDNPFLPKFYQNPEKYAFPLEMSFLAERYHQVKKELQSGDLFHETIISDYYFPKSLIFAKINLPEEEFSLYKNLFTIIHNQLPKPSLFVYLYAENEYLLSNIKKRGRTYEQSISDAYLLSIHVGYMEFIKQITDFPVLLIDMSKMNFVQKKEDFNKIVAILEGEYENGLHRIDL